MSAEYDAIAEEYNAASTELPLKIVCDHSLQRAVGELRGLDVIDLACGSGVFTRLCRKAGAGRVVGVDLSGEQIALARADEARAPLGIEYHVADVGGMGHLGDFDLATAIMLLHYAPTPDDLARMCHAVAANLKPGGRFVAVNLNPRLSCDETTSPEFAKYHVSCALAGPPGEGAKLLVKLETHGFTVQFHNYWYSPDTYEGALRGAGFHTIAWHDLDIPPELERAFGAAYWDLLIQRPLLSVLTCIR